MVIGNDLILFFCKWAHNFHTNIYWRHCLFLNVCYWHLCQNLVSRKYVDCFLRSVFCLLFSMFVFMPLPCCFGYYNFVECFEVRNYYSSSFVLFICLVAYNWLFEIFYGSIWILDFFLFLWRMTLIFDENCIESIDHFV